MILPERKYRVREFVYRIYVHGKALKKLVWSLDGLRTCTGYEGQVYWFSTAV